ncbi:MAG: caspase family protein [Isosphaeraceae bacterium]
MRIWAPDRDKPLLSLFVAGDDWIAWTPEGYYAAGPGGENLLGWQVSNGPEKVGTFVRASQCRKSLYRPDVIKLVLKTGSVATALERLKEPAKVVKEVLPPLVAITSPDSNGARLDKPELEVRAVAKAQPGHPVTAFRLLLDGRPYLGEAGRKPVGKDRASAKEVRESWTVRLEPGKHLLAVIAESAVSNGRSEEREVLYEEQRAERPRLFVLAVGVSKYPGPLRLNYAAADARSLEGVLRDKSGPLFESIEIKAVVDEDATRRNIIGNLKWLKQTMRDQDVGLFFFSGHGDFRDNLYYMLSVDAEVNDLESTAVPAAQLKSILATTKGKLVVLLDACHSGAQDAILPPRIPIRRIGWSQPAIPVWRTGSPDSLITRFQLLGSQQEGDLRPKQLRPSTDDLVRDLSNDEHGVITMSSSTGQEVSIESAEWKHGYFTQALTEGLSGKADMNNDGLVYLTELDAYLFNRVKDLSNNSQHPETAKPLSVRPFPLSLSRP